MDPKAAQWIHPGAGGRLTPGIRADAMASWLQPYRSRALSDIRISKSSIDPAHHCQTMAATSVFEPNAAKYSVKEGALTALNSLLQKCSSELPEDVRKGIKADGVKFENSSKGDTVLFPCPLKQQDTVSAIKGLEALMISVLANHRFGQLPRTISVDLMKVACFMSSAYITTLNGFNKASKEVRELLPSKLSI